MRDRESRRGFLQMAAIAATSLNAAPFAGALAQTELAPTPACHDGDAPTEPEIEGPFYKPRSPERANLLEGAAQARVVDLQGYILNRRCRPVARVLVDLWHADQNGDYDNRGFHYRGHIVTDASGQYRFRTIMPAPYPGRTRHYHFKVISTGRQLLTTQLYFPNEPLNLRDDFFHQSLLMKVADAGEALAARFDFVLDIR
jgi:protocatechuate 3,4-dioxygenase beta subunit